MIPIDPVTGATTVVPALPPDRNTPAAVLPPADATAPSVSSLGLFLSNLVLAQRSLRELAASGGDAAAFAAAAQQVVENTNANAPATLAGVVVSQQPALAQAGINVSSGGTLSADEGALASAFNASPQRAVAALGQALSQLAGAVATQSEIGRAHV